MHKHCTKNCMAASYCWACFNVCSDRCWAQQLKWEPEGRFRRTKVFLVAQHLPSEKLEKHTLQLQPTKHTSWSTSQRSFLFIAKSKRQIHGIGSGGYISFVQEVDKEAGSTQRNTSSKPGRLREAPCSPGLQSLLLSERTATKFPGKQEWKWIKLYLP